MFVLHTPHKVDDEGQPVLCFLHSRTDYRLHFTCGGLLDFLEHCKHIGQCINADWFSANGVRVLPKDQQTLHTCAPSWLQLCSGKICKWNLFCGYASYMGHAVA
jgi:hypothetical protein